MFFKLINHFLAKLTSEVLELIKYPLLCVWKSLWNFQKEPHDWNCIIWFDGSHEKLSCDLVFKHSILMKQDQLQFKLYVIFSIEIFTVLWVVWKHFAWVFVGRYMWNNHRHPLQLFANWRKNALIFSFFFFFFFAKAREN